MPSPQAKIFARNKLQSAKEFTRLFKEVLPGMLKLEKNQYAKLRDAKLDSGLRKIVILYDIVEDK